ncbi:lysophospholipid acyltransferase family protein [Acinetobacter sp. MD2(2019)]|uniref:lysophospholipid acyltransferase family protein n=1 Tax=Acinetobacter sp. MD2(2019) TaxID=2605273 RepID=UPI002D1EBA02|nr:lysophospholipid acyltransferase family protein [Acinetobacter sp. MD2(2019)]MEB3753601.1 1-acyl-sn-glycerol-3-phosphate acyltransferase [Acinetobacter sp. MD2(2019)]
MLNLKYKKKINYAWRMLATSFSFTSFGVGGLAVGCIIAPVVKRYTSDPEKRIHLTQQVIRHSFHGFIEMMTKLGIMTYSVEGLEKLQNSQGELLIANHPTLIDVVLLIGLMPKANCVVKQGLWRNPFTRGPVQNAKYILNEGSEQFIQDCVQRLQEPDAASLIIFPEGTRTAENHIINDFQRGAANIALRAQVPIRPVLIRCTPSTLTKNEKWYHIPSQAFHIQIDVLDPVHVTDALNELEVTPKNVRLLNQFFYHLFKGALSKHEQSC